MIQSLVSGGDEAARPFIHGPRRPWPASGGGSTGVVGSRRAPLGSRGGVAAGGLPFGGVGGGVGSGRLHGRRAQGQAGDHTAGFRGQVGNNPVQDGSLRIQSHFTPSGRNLIFL